MKPPAASSLRRARAELRVRRAFSGRTPARRNCSSRRTASLLSRLAAEGGGPDLEEKMQPVGLLHKRAQNRVAVAGFQHLGDIAVKPALQIVQFPHSKILKAPCRLTMSTEGVLGAYSPSRDQGRSSSVSRCREEIWRKTRPSLS